MRRVDAIVYFMISVAFSFIVHWPRWTHSDLEFLGAIAWGAVAWLVCWVVVLKKYETR